MARRSRLLVWVLFVTMVGMAWPSEVAAQRAAPRGAVRTGTAVPRSAGPHVARPYYGGGRYYTGRYYGYGYGYPRYYYPYAYAGYGYPYYSGFSFGFSVGFGWPGAYWGGYGYPYYYGVPYPAYRYYGYPYGAPYPYPDPRPAADQRSAPAAPPRATATGEFGTLVIRVVPADAVILVDGDVWERPQGDGRFSLDLAEGPHDVEVRKDGARPYVRTVDILGRRTFTLNVSLTPGESGPLPLSRR